MRHGSARRRWRPVNDRHGRAPSPAAPCARITKENSHAATFRIRRAHRRGARWPPAAARQPAPPASQPRRSTDSYGATATYPAPVPTRRPASRARRRHRVRPRHRTSKCMRRHQRHQAATASVRRRGRRRGRRRAGQPDRQRLAAAPRPPCWAASAAPSVGNQHRSATSNGADDRARLPHHGADRPGRVSAPTKCGATGDLRVGDRVRVDNGVIYRA